MPKPTEPQELKAVRPNSKTIKQCTCGATKFQGPFPVGTFVDGNFMVENNQYTCVNCHNVWGHDNWGSLIDRVVPIN